jgi:putative sterol carrier protein
VTTLTYVVGEDRHVVEAPGEGELTLLVPADVWARLTSGELAVSVAYMQGKVKVTGDTGALLDLLPEIPLS